MNKEQIYSNVNMLTSQLISNGMEPQTAVSQAEATTQKMLEATERLVKLAQTTKPPTS